MCCLQAVACYATFACGSAGGEIDVRGAYTALATAHMLRLDKAALAKQAGVVQYVCKCQVDHFNGCCTLCPRNTPLQNKSTMLVILVDSPLTSYHHGLLASQYTHSQSWLLTPVGTPEL